jgi:hypothetical protein
MVNNVLRVWGKEPLWYHLKYCDHGADLDSNRNEYCKGDNLTANFESIVY